MKNWKVLITICVLGCTRICAQETGANDTVSRHPLTHGVGIDFRPVYLIPTNEFFAGENAAWQPLRKSVSAHLKYSFRFHPDSRYGKLYPHTYQGIGVSYHSFFDKAEIGTPVAVYAFQGARITRLSSRLSLDYEWNFGASFGWKKYHPGTNAYNYVVGSKINAYINLGFFLNAKLSRYCNLLVGADLTHYSNGNTHLPNAGLNTIGGRIGLVYTLNPIEESHHEIGSARSLPENQLYLSSFWQRVSYDVILYGATRAKGVMLGDEAHIFPGQFGILGFNLNPMYKFNRFLKAGISLDGQYDESANIYSDEIIQVGEEPRFYRPPLHEQIGIGLSARGEFTMPFFSINIGVGHNLFYNKGDLKGLYQILALKVSVTRNLFLHVGYQLHKFHNPNNLMLGVGYRFHN